MCNYNYYFFGARAFFCSLEESIFVHFDTIFLHLREQLSEGSQVLLVEVEHVADLLAVHHPLSLL